MQTCAKCGAENLEGVVFCGECGAKFVPKKKIPVKYIIGGIILLLALAIGLHFLFDGQNSPSPQVPVVASQKAKPSTGVARKASPSVSRPTVQASSTCPNFIAAADFPSSITLGEGTNCASFTLNNGQMSPWIYAYGSSYAATALGKQPFEVIYSNGTVVEDGANQKVNAQPETNQFRIEAQVDGTQFDVAVTP